MGRRNHKRRVNKETGGVIINRISKIDEDVTTWVYDNEAGAYECFSKLFKGREKDNDGDSIYDCFYKYGGARFDTYDLRKEYKENIL